MTKNWAVPWKVKDALLVFLLAWVGLPVAIVLLLGELAPYVPFLSRLLTGMEQEQIWASFTFALVDALAALAIVAWYLRRYKVSWQALGLRKFNLVKATGYIVLGFILFYLVIAGVFVGLEWLVPSFNADQPQVNEFTKDADAARSLSLIALVLLPAIIEEIVFRGFVFPAFASRLGFWQGAVLSSLLFGLAHLQANITIYTLVLGVLLCIMYSKLKSIWPGIIFHMLNNYLAFALLLNK